MTVTQQQRLELLASLEAGAERIFPRTRQITHRFVPLIGNQYRNEISGARQAREGECIATIGLQPIGGGPQVLAGRDYLARVAAAAQLTRQRIAAGASFVDNLQSRRLADRCQRLQQLRRIRSSSADESWRLPARLGHGDRNGILVNVQSDKRGDTVVHGLPPLALGG